MRDARPIHLKPVVVVATLAKCFRFALSNQNQSDQKPHFFILKKFFRDKFPDFKLPALIAQAQQRKDKLLPASAPKAAVQLPLPKTPFDGYRRRKLIQLLNFGRYVGNRSVLEIGCGIGDLLLEMSKYGPKEIYGVDSSEESIALAKEYTKGINADLSVADARNLPFPDKSFDVVFVMFELQHIADDRQMKRVVDEAARVSRQWVILVEETATKKYQHESITRRRVEDYKNAFKHSPSGRFFLRKTDYLHVNASRYIFTGTANPWHWLRWLFSPLLYLMGFPASVMKPPTQSTDLPDSKLAMLLQKWSLPLTNSLDNIFKANDGITVMWLEREKLFGRG